MTGELRSKAAQPSLRSPAIETTFSEEVGGQLVGTADGETGELHSEAAQPSLRSPVSPSASAELGGVDNVGDRG